MKYFIINTVYGFQTRSIQYSILIFYIQYSLFNSDFPVMVHSLQEDIDIDIDIDTDIDIDADIDIY